jgi:hypothetical protein
MAEWSGGLSRMNEYDLVYTASGSNDVKNMFFFLLPFFHNNSQKYEKILCSLLCFVESGYLN